MSGWPRVVWVLPVNPDTELRLSGPRHMTPAEWARMLELLDAMRPGIVQESEPQKSERYGV